jgi:hypothetical protein
MSADRSRAGGAARRTALRACLLIVGAFLGFVAARPVRAASNIPDIPVWVNVGAWQDSSRVPGQAFRCVGSFQGPLADSLRRQSKTLSVRFLRDRATESRPDFGGYRIYRMQNSADSSHAVLIRRFSLNAGSELTWNASRVTRTSSISALFNDGSGALQPRLELATGVLPAAIAIGDMNRDGKPDLVIANEGANTVTQLFSNGGTGFLGRTDLNVGTVPSDVALADVNGDGRLDIVVTSAETRDLVVVPTSSLGGFLLPVSTPVGLGPSRIAIADLNLDGRPDYVVASSGSDTVTVVLGAAAGVFGNRTTVAVGSRPSALALGDMNGDDILDLAVANAGSNNVTLLQGVPGGIWVNRRTVAVGIEPSGVALRDVNGDSKLDLLVTNAGSNTVSVMLGDGAGNFAGVPDLTTGTTPRGIDVGDVNGDGKLDVAVANQGSNDVSVFRGDGTGAFTAQPPAAVGVAPFGVTLGDLSSDGKPDVFTADRSYQLPYVCNNAVVNDSILTFVDPDSNGRFIKVCRRPGTETGRCETPGDSIFILSAPPGPHDGFLTWYSITIERKNTTDPDYEDLFLPDTLNNFARCTDPNDRGTCPNLNHKLRNLAGPVEPTAGPTANLEKVLAVPNPYRGSEVWDQPGQGEVHFINLPTQAKIRIYTAAGDLVREIQHNDKTRDFERWDLKNGAGNAVASGIYMYRIEAGLFHFQSRLVVIR